MSRPWPDDLVAVFNEDNDVWCLRHADEAEGEEITTVLESDDWRYQIGPCVVCKWAP